MEKPKEISLRTIEMQRDKREEELRAKIEVKDSRILEAENEVTSAKEKEALMEAELKETKKEIDSLRDRNRGLILKDVKANIDFKIARLLVMKIMQEFDSESETDDSVGVKKMGKVDIQPFYASAKRKYPHNSLEQLEQAVRCCRFMRDPKWYPFKIITDNYGNVTEEIIDEDDYKLKLLKSEHDDEVYKAVTKALIEMMPYYDTGRYPVVELWNFLNNRRATLLEGILAIKLHLHKRIKN